MFKTKEATNIVSMVEITFTASRIHWLLETNGCNLDEVFSYIAFLTKEIAILNNRFPCLLLFIVNNILYILQPVA